MLIGCGTAQRAEQAENAIASGAQFVVSNLVNEEVIKTANLNGTLCIPAARDDAQVRTALSLGCWVIKLFLPMPTLSIEANISNLSQFQNIFPRVQFLVTGGVELLSVKPLLDAGFPLLVPNLVRSDILRRKAWPEITNLARRFKEEAQTAIVQ